MEFDLKKTLDLVKGGLTDPEANWKAWLADNPPWQRTLGLLTGPLLVANVVVVVVLARLFGGYAAYGVGGGFVVMLLRGLVMAAIGFLVAVFAFNLLAGVFKGKPDFSRAFAAVSLAAIPAWVAGMIGAAIPWLGFLVSLAGGIWSLVLLYRIMPLALDVPEDKRILHYVLSLVAAFFANLVIGSVVGLGSGGVNIADRVAVKRPSGAAYSTDVSSGTGLFGNAQRQAALMEAAAADRYDPPGDGEVSEDQVEYLLSVTDKARAAAEERTQRIQELSQEMEDKDSASPADLLKVYQGMGTAVSLNNVEMEVVKTGGGNWAEYRWVKEQLRVARLQRGEGSEALAHNFRLYEKYREQLVDLL